MASFSTINHAEQSPSPPDPANLKMPYRSYKKKFLKMRHQFREKMRESNTLYDHEQQAKQISRRIQEEIDQLLDVLLDVNDSTRIPSHLRYDLRSPPPDESDVPALISDTNPPSPSQVQQAYSALQEAKSELQAGTIDRANYEETEAALTAMINQQQTLANLSKTSHSTLEAVPPELVPELYEDPLTGYLTPAHEEEYLAAVDAYLDAPHPVDQPLPPRIRSQDRERERETQLKNPMSVYNWLSSHRPRVYEDDRGDISHDKAPRPAAPRKTSPAAKPSASTPNTTRSNAKREKAGSLLAKPEEEVLDEDGSVIAGFVEETGAGRQQKRKRGQDDDAYRPKGGGSKKRKRAGTKNSTPGGEGKSGRTEAEGSAE